VRPHELDIDLHPMDAESVRARIVRIQSAGPIVRIELTTQDGEALHVEIPHDRHRELQLIAGAVVYVRVKSPALISAESGIASMPRQYADHV